MALKFVITKETQNHVVGRVELEGMLSGVTSTPSRHDVLTAVAHAKSVSPDQVVILKVGQAFGTRGATVVAHVYASAESAAKSAPAFFGKRGVAEPKKGESAPAAKPAAAKPAAPVAAPAPAAAAPAAK